jgi:signal transduction histidine kinase
LTSVATWPPKGGYSSLIPAGRQALLEEDTIIISRSGSKDHTVAIPLMAKGRITGVLVLVSRSAFTPSQRAFLQVAASMMALIISNSQLYTKLERHAVLEERNRLAREVHDGLAQSLGFLNFKMQHIGRLLDREQWEAARQGLQEMRTALGDLYDEVRLTIQDLRWSPEDGQGLVEQLQHYIAAFRDRTGLEVSFVVEGEPNLSPRDEIHLFRIVQEALANVHKHAHARQIWVRLCAGTTGAILEVEDDGDGMPSTGYPEDAIASSDPAHFGLRIMRERAEAIGGQMSVQSAPGKGTRLQVEMNGASLLITPSLSQASESN